MVLPKPISSAKQPPKLNSSKKFSQFKPSFWQERNSAFNSLGTLTSLIDLKEEGTNMNELTQVLAENQEEWITPKKVVNKPVDDIVDATWILLFLKNNLK